MKLPKSTLTKLVTDTNTEHTAASQNDTVNVHDTASRCVHDATRTAVPTSAHKTRALAPSVCRHAPGTDLNARAVQNELAILHWIERFGWLATAQLAELVWRRRATRMAQTTLARLLDYGEAVKHELPNGVPFFLLPKRGADRLARAGYDNPQPTNRTYKRLIEACNRAKRRTHVDTGSRTSPNSHKWQHRMLCNWTCIYAREHGYGFFTEHEIEQGRAPFYRYAGKVPDALLIVTDNDDRWLLWVEVEHSRRSARDRRRIATWIRALYPALWQQALAGTGGTTIGGILFVIPSNQEPLLTAIRNALMNSATTRAEADLLLELARDSVRWGLRYVRLGVTPKLGCTGFDGGFDAQSSGGFVCCEILDSDEVERVQDGFPSE